MAVAWLVDSKRGSPPNLRFFDVFVETQCQLEGLALTEGYLTLDNKLIGSAFDDSRG